MKTINLKIFFTKDPYLFLLRLNSSHEKVSQVLGRIQHQKVLDLVTINYNFLLKNDREGMAKGTSNSTVPIPPLITSTGFCL